MEDGEFLKNGEAPVPAPSLFPVAPSRIPPSTSSAGPSTLFPSFASAPPVFPIADSAGLQLTPAPEWFSNSSFPESLLPPPPTTTSYPSDSTLGHEEEAGRQGGPGDAGAPSSSEGEDSEKDSAELRRQRKKLHKKRRKEAEGKGSEKKHRKREPEHDADKGNIGKPDSSATLVGRRPGATSWVDRNADAKKDYYFDTRGDRDNLIYGTLYKMDVARYHRSAIRGNAFDRGFLVYFDGLGVAQDEKVETGGRYWSLKFSSLQRKRRLKQLKFGSHKFERKSIDSKSAPLGHFVPLETVWLPTAEEEGDLEEENREEGETWLEYVAHKTKELNQLSRERSHDESVWIRFADFQDELIQATGSRAAVRNLIAKKMAILEKALDSHKDSECLLILYLETCKRSDDATTLLRKWERAVHSRSGSLRMWQEFLRFRRGQFSTFSVSALRSLYNHAIQALTAARNKLASKAIGEDNYQYTDFVEVEEALVSIFLDLCRFNWQAGHQELAIGLFQAQIEYSLFSPRLLLTESGKLTLFESFWSSGAPRFGEEGALGWETFLEEDQKARESKVLSEAQMEEEEVGGWTGWSAPSKELVDSSSSGQPLEEEAWSMEEDVELGEDMVQEEEDEAALLEKLGLSFSSTKDVEVKDTKIWKRWSEKEVERDREQWLPVNSQLSSEEDDQLESMVLFDDIKECLFTLKSQQARLSLIHQFIDFCNGPLSQWCCSNSDNFRSELDSLVSLNRTIVADMDSFKWPEHVGEKTLAKLLGGPLWYEESKGRAKFLQNCLGLLKSVLPHDRFLSDAMLKTEDLSAQEVGSQKIPSRVLAKKVLKKHRKDLLMWGAYACIEAAAGNLTTARTVFDTTLASLGDPSTEGARDAPILYLAYAEMELGQGSNEPPDISAQQRAMYILCYLGSGSVYVPQSDPDSLPTTTLLRGHRGYREHLQRVRLSDRRNLTERGAALIACAAMFEQLTNGWEAGTAVFEEGLAMSLPETRQQSLQCELLFLRYIRMLQKSKHGPKPARFRSTLSQGLRQYPRNSKLIGAYVESGFQSARSFELRRYFDDASIKHSSPTLWLFALSCEMWTSGKAPRIHRLFERGLESKETQHCVLLWRCYLANHVRDPANAEAARRVYFRAIHACPWSKTLWVDGFLMLGSILSAKELSEFVDVMRDKELRLRTDVYEILLEDEV